MVAAIDDSPRPHKRLRTLGGFAPSPPSKSTLSPPPPCQPQQPLRPLPAHNLLLVLPSILLHPPNHRHHIQSLVLSIESTRKCLAQGTLDPDIECRAWATLAELDLIAINGGFHLSQVNKWARGIEVEIEKAISKGLLIAQKHTSLRAYKLNLILLSARLTTFQHPKNPKPTRTLLRRLLSALHPNDPPHVVYSAHLALVTLHTQQEHNKPDTVFALASLDDLLAEAQRRAHKEVCVLSRVLRLRVLVSAEMWDDVGDALKAAELALFLTFSPTNHPKSEAAGVSSDSNGNVTSSLGAMMATQPPETVSENKTFEASMTIHTLILGIMFYTRAGGTADVSMRLARLHAMLDEGVLKMFPDGLVEVRFHDSPSLVLHTTHPRVLYLLAFLVSATVKRDPVGRKPKRWLFATEGLTAWEREAKRGLELPRWAGMGDAEEIEKKLVGIKADLLCELVGVSIMRSEFDEAGRTLDVLIAHTRTYELFSAFSARITLYHAHLAHALGDGARALECYRVAAYLAEKEGGEGEFVKIAARAGEVALRFGICAGGGMRGKRGELEEEEMEEIMVREMGIDVVRACRGKGGTLESVGKMLEGCLSKEMVKAKGHLKRALEIASGAQDSHMRAIVLALISGYYMHTAGGHAREILKSCEQIASGTGNAALRLWVGERVVELDKRRGEGERAERQMEVNRKLVEAVKKMAKI